VDQAIADLASDLLQLHDPTLRNTMRIAKLLNGTRLRHVTTPSAADVVSLRAILSGSPIPSKNIRPDAVSKSSSAKHEQQG